MTTLKIVNTTGEPFECDDCGTCYPEGVYVCVDDVVVWEKSTDGHYSGYQTEESISECILNYIKKTSLELIDNGFTEEARFQWNKNYPGNAVASTPENWLEYKRESISILESSCERLTENCQILPYAEHLQVKMIALWLEEEFGDKVQIIEEEERE